jgi:hypothetical protein
VSRDREFEPLRRGARTGSAGWILLGGFVPLVAVAVVARLGDQGWWVTPALVAVTLGVAGPIAFVVAWREGIGRTLVVRPDAVEMVKTGRRGTDRTVVRRDVAEYRAAYAPVQRGPQTSGSDRILLVADGRESIWVVDASWGLDTQRRIAEALGVPFRDEWTTRADLKASVNMPSPLWERRPVLLGVIFAVSIPVVVFAAAAIGVLLS